MKLVTVLVPQLVDMVMVVMVVHTVLVIGGAVVVCVIVEY